MDRPSYASEESLLLLRSAEQRMIELERRVRRIENLYDTYSTPAWKRLLFVIDGWPLWRIVERPQWRPWRRWWTS